VQRNPVPTTDKILYYLFDRKNPRIESAAGYYFRDVEGRQYLDGTSAAFNCVLGHTMPERVAEAFRRRTTRHSFASMAHFENDAVNGLATRLLGLMPDYAAVGFFQSGADAVEATLRCALQVARTRHSAKRSKIIGRRGNYHGLTLGALGLQRADAVPPADLPSFVHLDPHDCFGVVPGAACPDAGAHAAADLERLVEKEGPDTIAAFVGVPSISGGPVPDEYWPRVREICDRYGILLVLDDVLEGLWRLGPAVGVARWGVVPDVLANGKVLGAGFMPIFAMLVTAEIRDTLSQEGRFWGGHTYSGHMLSCEVGSAVLEEIEERKLSTTGVEAVGRNLDATLKRVSEERAGSRMASLGALGRLRVPCAVPPDSQAFYLQVQAWMREAGLIVWIDDIQPGHPGPDRPSGYVDFSFGPPFVADAEYFHELELRLTRFVATLPRPEREAG